MTTILITEDFILSDRRNTEGDFSSVNHFEESKMWIDPRGRGAMAIAGSRKVKLDTITLSRYFEAAFLACETMAEVDLAAFRKLTSSFFRELFNVYLITAKGSFTLNEDIKQIADPFISSTGSGSTFATAAYLYEVKPEDIVPLVATFDEYTSPEFDIFYKKDIK